MNVNIRVQQTAKHGLHTRVQTVKGSTN